MKKYIKFLWGGSILVSSMILAIAQFYKNQYRNNELEEIIFYLKTGLSGADLSVFREFFKVKTIHVIIMGLLFILPIILIKKLVKNRKSTYVSIYCTLVLLGSFFYSYNLVGLNEYLAVMKTNSDFIETNYVDTSKVKLTFPKEKRNLIILFLESMETTMISTESLGGWDYTVIPELEKLALNNINFSNTEKLGGARRSNGSGWTIGGLVGITSGIPLKTPGDANEYKSDNFLGGVTSLGDILKKEGYNLEFMFGSDSTYGGRKHYFINHGNYEIFDLVSAIDEGYMTEDEKVFWGFEDGKLFEWAKDEILELAEKDEPFNFNLLTVNTHFPDGWEEADIEKKYKTQYENVHAYSSKQINDFINWLKEQDFYYNTSIVLVGDHNSMQEAEYYEDKINIENYTRVTYNAFINSSKEPIKEKNRTFSNYDLFPTILSSMGAEIEGNKLGLGVDLFSDEETLFEKYGVEFADSELSKGSEFYKQSFLQIYE